MVCGDHASLYVHSDFDSEVEVEIGNGYEARLHIACHIQVLCHSLQAFEWIEQLGYPHANHKVFAFSPTYFTYTLCMTILCVSSNFHRTKIV